MAARSKGNVVEGRFLLLERLEPRHLLTLITFNPVADTYIGASTGAESVLEVRDYGIGGGDHIAYLRFDLSGYEIDDINDAELTLYKQPASRSDTIVTGRFKNYGLTNDPGNTPQDWIESTLGYTTVGEEYTNVGGNLIDVSQVFNLDADSGANVYESVNNTDGAPQTVSGPDLVTFLESRIADDGLVTFITLVDSGDAGRGWGYGSRENAEEYLRPELTIDFEGQEIPDPYPENPVRYARQVEDLDRGVVAVRSSSTAIYIGWRMLGTDPDDVAFNVYRSSNGGAAVKLNSTPVTQTTDWVDDTAPMASDNEYFVCAIIDGVEQDPGGSFTVEAFASVRQYLDVPLQIPEGGVVPDHENPGEYISYTYTANDASVGDVDGDGQYEIILKWDPTNAKDNSQAGYTGNVYLDAYELDGTLLWRIDLGVNIRAGAHYTQYMVYDLDGDGRSEVACKTAEGTVDGLGTYIANDSSRFFGDFPTDVNNAADHRNEWGYILTGYEFLTVFDGQTGAELATTFYNPARNDDVTSPDVSAWGDNYGNRVDRFLAGVAYLDGERPSLVMCRGYYTRAVLVAYDWRDGQLTERWVFDSNDPGNAAYAGQGAHSLSIADVDGDGYDEIVYGACVIDNDGTGLYSTGLGHGDALHVSDMDPTNPGLEVFMVHESSAGYVTAGGEFRDAMTGELIFGMPAGGDVGRGVAADIDPNSPGYEMWATVSDRYIYGADGTQLYESGNVFYNFVAWWDADLSRELLDGTTIAEWNNPGRSNIVWYGASGINNNSGLSSNNGTKSTPALSADILGDWREEVIWRTSDNTALQIWTTAIPAVSRMFTLMHDTQYREAIAWQNVAYNQPPHPSFWIGEGMTTPEQPNVYLAGPGTIPIAGDFNNDGSVDDADQVVWQQTFGTTFSGGDFGDADGDGDADLADLLIWQKNYGQTSTSLAAAVPPDTLAAEAQSLSVEAEPVVEPAVEEAVLAQAFAAEFLAPPVTASLTDLSVEAGNDDADPIVPAPQAESPKPSTVGPRGRSHQTEYRLSHGHTDSDRSVLEQNTSAFDRALEDLSPYRFDLKLSKPSAG